MDPERYQRLRHLIVSALDHESGRREAFLQGACAEDPDLLREALSLLAYDDAVSDGLNRPADAGSPPSCAASGPRRRGSRR